VTHDQEEAMTMADVIAVMNNGRIEQLGTPLELYERPRTRFVAGFLGVSNLLPAAVVAESTVRLDDGTILRASVPSGAGRLAIGVRPEKIELSGAHDNKLAGVVVESAYVGVATQYIVETPTGRLSVYVQNARPGAQGAAAPGDRVTLSWDPNSTFVVDATEESS
jgi:spermidine/putrescine transport system ATP-binding protein